MNNVFANYGTIIYDRYINRELEKDLNSRINGENYGSYALIGAPRVGKSCLVYNFFKEVNNKIIIDISTIATPDELFSRIIKKIYKQLKKINFLDNETIEDMYDDFKDYDNKKEGFLDFCESLNENLKEINEKFFIVLDEFDAVIKIFKSNTNYFQSLREIAYMPPYSNIILVLISRRRIEEIEAKIEDVSIFSNVLRQNFLKIKFSDEEKDKYFNFLSKYINVDENLKQVYKKYSGFNPFLMDIISYHLLNGVKIEEIENYIKDEFYKYFITLEDLLKKQNLLQTLLNIVFNFIYLDNDTTNEMKLNSYGIVDSKEIFCEYFKEYLLHKADILDFYHLWSTTENNLKELLKKEFYKEYGSDWENILKNEYKSEDFIKNAEYYCTQEKKLNKKLDLTIVDCLSTSGIFKLIKLKWEIFNKIFIGRYQEWKKNFDSIIKMRNIFAHNRLETIKENYSKVEEVILLCKEINKKIKENYEK
jgi:GTPase SAR1 family protein